MTMPKYGMGSGIKVKDVMVKKIITMDAKKSIADAAKMMKKHEIGSVIIVNAKKQAIGIVTERDMVRRAVAKGMDSKAPLSGIMSKAIFTTAPDTEIENAARMMIRNGVKRLPVIDRKGVLVGIISDDDMAKAWPGLIDLAEEKGYLKGET
jgi:CBS domain-containing protein